MYRGAVFRFLLLAIFLAALVLAYFDIYNMIINYHIIIYLSLTLLPLTIAAQQSLSLPLLVFIQFFWATLSIGLLTLLPLYDVISILYYCISWLIDIMRF